KKRYPHQLSGGQQQRIALARALAPKPDILLLDEPFSNLDVELREHLAHDVRQLIKAEKVTAILVTHDQQEAFATSDKIALLNNGKLIQWGSANELYDEPNSVFSAEFIGQGALIEGAIKKDNNGANNLHTEVGNLTIAEHITHNDSAKLLIRPDKIAVSNSETGIPVTLINKSFRGGHYLCSLKTSNKQLLTALLPAQNIPDPGTQLFITVSLSNTTPIIY
ncbi:MAG: ABC transporter ATP-binding protein, partial [Pseudomonadales bacterium]|nr:ABC transporter ATP-binding protein [Pseudomonadales bacterium]